MSDCDSTEFDNGIKTGSEYCMQLIVWTLNMNYDRKKYHSDISKRYFLVCLLKIVFVWYVSSRGRRRKLITPRDIRTRHTNLSFAVRDNAYAKMSAALPLPFAITTGTAGSLSTDFQTERIVFRPPSMTTSTTGIPNSGYSVISKWRWLNIVLIKRVIVFFLIKRVRIEYS